MLLGIVGGLIAVGALFCCGGALLVVNFGMSIVSAEVQDQLASRPEIQDNIGPIESFKVNYARTGTHDDDETFVYDIQGPKGQGYVEVKQYTNENDEEVIESAVLTMNDGQKIPIEF